jgi:hypothetical protein
MDDWLQTASGCEQVKSFYKSLLCLFFFFYFFSSLSLSLFLSFSFFSFFLLQKRRRRRTQNAITINPIRILCFVQESIAEMTLPLWY